MFDNEDGTFQKKINVGQRCAHALRFAIGLHGV